MARRDHSLSFAANVERAESPHNQGMTNPAALALLLSAATLATACAERAGAASLPESEQLAQHIALMETRIDASNRHDWSTWQSLHTDDAVRTAPELPGPLAGSAAMRAGIEELVATFPDYHLELVDAFGQGDRLTARIHTRATMLGPMQLGSVTIPPTGRPFEQDWIAIVTFDGDRITAIDEFHDNYTILLQLGLAEMP